MRVELQPAYVLHTRPYRDTSLLAEVITPDYGRVGLLARGVRRGKGQRRALLNPFKPLLVSFQGRGGLKLMTGLEPGGSGYLLQGKALYCGFYLNELLMRLLAEMDEQPQVFGDYEASLAALSRDSDLEPWLRRFELSLLEHLGYGLDLRVDVTGRNVQPEGCYELDPLEGLTPVEPSPESAENPWIFIGEDLQALGAGDLTCVTTRRAAKRLTRIMLQPLLGSRPLKSRELFKSR